MKKVLYMHKSIHIKPKVLFDLNLDGPTRGYIHPNPLLRYIFWKRFDKVICKVQPCDNILEIGFGQGLLLVSLSKLCNQLYGIDPNYNKSVINLLNSYGVKNASISNDSVLDIPFKNEYFSTIISCDVLEHIKDLDSAFREINRVLANDGKLIISLPSENFFYRIGRWIGGMAVSGEIGFRKAKKPRDHYFNHREVLNLARTYFYVVKSEYIFWWFPIFRCAVLKKKDLM